MKISGIKRIKDIHKNLHTDEVISFVLYYKLAANPRVTHNNYFYGGFNKNDLN